jgi:hypothetical protein
MIAGGKTEIECLIHDTGEKKKRVAQGKKTKEMYLVRLLNKPSKQTN